jgi:hypothetical protein
MLYSGMLLGFFLSHTLCHNSPCHTVLLRLPLALESWGLYGRLLCGAGAAAATYTCGDHVVAEAESEVVAMALAEATVVAVSTLYVECVTTAGAYACADAGTHISDTAYAVAKVSRPSFPVAIASFDTSFH